ncbi:hypothetical protein [uncultured Mitsuokella sp.]|uniref:hypothetical protein n=1 Tax=uncultured Mitsuokella sp. TaxID=453120 RepID=UPI0025F18EE2|nr:hypothetical protein [uncultured Mitsuokella sp.]
MSTALSILKAFSSLLADKFNILSLKYDKYSQKFIFMTDIPTERDDFFMYKLHQRKALRSFSLALLAASSLTFLRFASTAAAAAPLLPPQVSPRQQASYMAIFSAAL